MPVASNPLLQTAAASQASTATGLQSSKLQEPAPSGADSFASVYSRQSQANHAQKADAAQAYADKLASAAANKASFARHADAGNASVADSGKSLPAKSSQVADSKPADHKQVDSKQEQERKVDQHADKDGEVDNDQEHDQPVDASTTKETVAEGDDSRADTDSAAVPAGAGDPLLDPTALLATTPMGVEVAADAATTPIVDPSLLGMLAPPLSVPVSGADTATDSADGADAFDPSADILADLPALRLALEQSAKAQGTTSVHADAQAATAAQQADDTLAAAGLAGMLEQQVANEGKAGSELGAAGLEESAKGIKGGIGEASAGSFADRLGALAHVTNKPLTSAVATPPASPLVMNQSGWTEGVVNRVMYLSSQNLKSADIQLSPAELGRLDIKVTMDNDQTQVTFVSAHVGVREALENQQGRLKDMFAQQGLGQMDVNVSDQSRQQHDGQPQAQDSARGASARSGRGEATDADDTLAELPGAIHSTSVIGSSAVDYYA